MKKKNVVIDVQNLVHTYNKTSRNNETYCMIDKTYKNKRVSLDESINFYQGTELFFFKFHIQPVLSANELRIKTPVAKKKKKP